MLWYVAITRALEQLANTPSSRPRPSAVEPVDDSPCDDRGYLRYHGQGVLTTPPTHRLTSVQGQAQDFRDREGDAAIGRKTLALILPQGVGRWSLAALLYAWTTALVWFWLPPAGFSLLLYVLATAATYLFVTDYTEESDRRAYWWYNVRPAFSLLFAIAADPRVARCGSSPATRCRFSIAFAARPCEWLIYSWAMRKRALFRQGSWD